MAEMIKYQGSMDGLCGPYAIVNAFVHCGLENPDDLFQTACGAVSRRRWPGLLWLGTEIGDMEKMIAACRKKFPTAEAVNVRYPFKKNRPKNNDEFRDYLLENLEIGALRQCAILEITKPRWHWIVSHRESEKKLSFIDSDGPKNPRVKKLVTSLHAGTRRRDPNKWLLELKSCIMFKAS